MKKIVSAALLAAMVAGAASAEVKITSNFRIRPVLFQLDTGTEAADLQTLMSLDNSQMKAGQGATDTFKLEAKNDYAGVVTEVNIGATNEKLALTTSNQYGFLKFGK